MGKPTGFKEYQRELPGKRPVKERIKDFKEIYRSFPKEKLKEQAARCMDCGVPTCHAGCPLGNLIPDWNDFVFQDQWHEALLQLLLTNNFPEFTGRLCPAPCEEACVLAINEPAVTIEQIEKEIIEHAFARGWIKPEPPQERTGKSVAVIGSGPSGLNPISARDKHVVVIGGGDTGSDCIGTSIRQKAGSVTNFELFPKPTGNRPDNQPWPFWPIKLRTSTSHEEGCQRQWGILTKEFIGDGDRIVKLTTIDVEFVISGQGRTAMREIEGSTREWPADLVLLALGFTGPESHTVVGGYGLQLDERGNVQTDNNHMTAIPGVFAAGDSHRGQSLIVWAISEGREAARRVDVYLMGASQLPLKGGGDLPRI